MLESNANCVAEKRCRPGAGRMRLQNPLLSDLLKVPAEVTLEAGYAVQRIVRTVGDGDSAQIKPGGALPPGPEHQVPQKGGADGDALWNPRGTGGLLFGMVAVHAAPGEADQGLGRGIPFGEEEPGNAG